MRFSAHVRVLLVSTLLSVVACGGRASKNGDGEGSESGGDGDTSTPPDPDPPPDVPSCEAPDFPPLASTSGTLDIPLVPTTCLGPQLLINLFEEPDTGTRWEAMGFDPLVLALGEEYPASVRLDIESLSVSPSDCGLMALPGELEVTHLESSGAGLDIELDDSGAIVFSAVAEGTYDVRIEGEHVFDPEDLTCETLQSGQISVGADLVVQVTRPAGATLSTLSLAADCGAQSAPLLLSGQQLETFAMVPSVYPTDAAGELMFVQNAVMHRSVSVTVLAEAGTELTLGEPERGISSLVAVGPTQLMRVTSNGREAGTIGLVAHEDIDDWTVQWQSIAGRIEETLTSGDTYVLGDPMVDYVTASPRFFYDERPICTGVHDELALLVSDTPDICPASDEPGYLSADVLGPGLCTLRLVAPAVNSGQGLEEILEIEFVDGAE